MPLERSQIFPEPELARGTHLLSDGARLAADWNVGPSVFLDHLGVNSEYEFKLRQMEAGAVMQHAQIGYRDIGKSCRAYVEIWEACQQHGVGVDRYGLCLDWSMAVPRDLRLKATQGTGMILLDVEDFVRLANSAPVAPHFGDFVLGFPAALENTKAALSAGSTSIGNLGQYFTFRVPGYVDDLAATTETVRAIGLIAAQPVPVIIHSNIDDGFGAQFTDLASCLGMMLLERYLIERLAGAKIGHCYGHHFSDPLARCSFQTAMASAGLAPGTVIYGNTTSYRGSPAENLASLSSYLLVDAIGQAARPTGHAINAVPVTENSRIPDIDEVIEAQLLAGRLKVHALDWRPLLNDAAVQNMARRILAGGRKFHSAVLQGLHAAGVDTEDLFEMLLALRRIGARRLEAEFGPGPEDTASMGGRVPVVAGTIVSEIAETAKSAIAKMPPGVRETLARSDLKVLVAAGDVHEHGKMVVGEVVRGLGLTALDGGVSTDPDTLARSAIHLCPDVIAVSTYNGVARSYFQELHRALLAAGRNIPVIMGGRLNQIAEGSNSSLPVDVTAELRKAGAITCPSATDLGQALVMLFPGISDSE